MTEISFIYGISSELGNYDEVSDTVEVNIEDIYDEVKKMRFGNMEDILIDSIIGVTIHDFIHSMIVNMGENTIAEQDHFIMDFIFNTFQY